MKILDCYICSIYLIVEVSGKTLTLALKVIHYMYTSLVMERLCVDIVVPFMHLISKQCIYIIKYDTTAIAY